MNAKQQRIHWIISHIANLLVIVLILIALWILRGHV